MRERWARTDDGKWTPLSEYCAPHIVCFGGFWVYESITTERLMRPFFVGDKREAVQTAIELHKL